MNISLYKYTNEGSRAVNEDNLGINNFGNFVSAVVCDGLGGHNRGDVASKLAVEKITEGISRLDSINAESIRAILKSANNAIVKKQNENSAFEGMRTTVVGCIVDNRDIYYFNCGDSRFYYFSGGSVASMSKDHSVLQTAVDRGEISPDDIRFDESRNKLYKVLGDDISGESGTVYTPIAYKSGDAFILCSDGFWENILEEEMEIDLSKSSSAQEWVEYMLVRLLLRLDGTNDNFTVIGGIIE